LLWACAFDSTKCIHVQIFEMSLEISSYILGKLHRMFNCTVFIWVNWTTVTNRLVTSLKNHTGCSIVQFSYG
jgi:hypothetical protein